MKTILLALAVFCGSWFASAQQEQFIVYDLSAKVDGVGVPYATNTLADGGETRNTWKGKLLYDAGSGLAAIIWRTKLDRRDVQDWRNKPIKEKVQELISLDLSVLDYSVQDQPGQRRNVFALTASDDLANFPDDGSASFIVLLGDVAKRIVINRTETVPVEREISARLAGRLWFLSQNDASYRYAKLTARFNLTDTLQANEQLGDYNHDGFYDLDDVIDFWQELYRPEWKPIND